MNRWTGEEGEERMEENLRLGQIVGTDENTGKHKDRVTSVAS